MLVQVNKSIESMGGLSSPATERERESFLSLYVNSTTDAKKQTKYKGTTHNQTDLFQLWYTMIQIPCLYQGFDKKNHEKGQQESSRKKKKSSKNHLWKGKISIRPWPQPECSNSGRRPELSSFKAVLHSLLEFIKWRYSIHECISNLLSAKNRRDDGRAC